MEINNKNHIELNSKEIERLKKSWTEWTDKVNQKNIQELKELKESLNRKLIDGKIWQSIYESCGVPEELL